MRSIVFRLCCFSFALAIGSLNAWSQATAQISGTVKDQSGAVLPGVEITATQADTGIKRTAITNETGSFVLPNLPIGPYRLEAALPGFRTFAQTGILLEVNSSPVVNPILEVGQVTESVEVEANAALVETRNAGVGQVIENARILELPLNGRNAVELISLNGATTPSAFQVNASSRDNFNKGGDVAVAGGMSNGLTYLLDGGFHNNMLHGGYVTLPFPDALQEFKVETSATNAQGGMRSAGTVSVVTKSGTNQLHGDLFEFVRNYVFNARNTFANSRDSIKRNQFGGTVGGPIVHDKLFFFAGYQGTLIRQSPSDNIAFVPTPAMRSGDFTVFASPACNGGRQINLGAPFVGNRVDPSLLSKAALLLSSKFPSTPDPCGKITYGIPSLENDHQAIGRIDYQKSAKHTLFGRYLIESDVSPAAFDLRSDNPLVITNATAASDGLTQAFTLGSTYLFNNNVVNSLRLTATRVATGKFAPKEQIEKTGLTSTALGIRAYDYEPTAFRANVTSAFNYGSQGGPTRTATVALNEDLNVLRGNHQLALGASVAYWWVNSYSGQQTINFTFTGAGTGMGLADFLVGRANQFTNGPVSATLKRSKYIGLYASDTWKATRKLTLSYGLRWEPYFPMINADGTIAHFDEDALNKGIRSSKFDTTPPGVFFPGDPGFPGLAGRKNRYTNVSPRLGLAWDVAGDGRTSVRASVGRFFDYPTAYYYSGASATPPQFPRFQLSSVNLDNPWANYPGGDPFPMLYGRSAGRNSAWPLNSIVYSRDYDAPNMEVTDWNLTVQRQIGRDWLLSTAYLGSSIIHAMSVRQLNQGVFLGLGPCTLNGVSYNTCSTTANLNQRRRLTLQDPAVGRYYGYVVHEETGGTGTYNGMVVSIQRRAARGITVNANYTWSHCIADPGLGDMNGVGGTFNQGWNHMDNRRLDRGNCHDGATDHRHVFNTSGVLESPQFSNAVLRKVGSGWRLSPLIKLLSGDYISVSTSQDIALTGQNTQRVNQVLANPYGRKTANNYLNSAAFALPAPGTLGTMGAASIEGPNYWQFDLALSRVFRLGEVRRVEFRGEAFNVLNGVRLNDPVTNFNSGNFGQITSARDPRILQFALKYVF